MKNVLCIVTIIITCVSVAYSITCQEAIQFALKQADSIEMAEETSQTIRESGKQAIAFIYPQANLSGSYFEKDTSKKDSPLFPFLNQSDREVSAAFQVSQLIFAGGRIWMSNALNDNLIEQAEWQLNATKKDLTMQVRINFYGALYQSAAVEIFQDRLAQRKAELEDALDLRNVGVVTSLDVRQAQLSLNLAKDELNAALAKHQDGLIDFNTIIGRSVQDDLFIPEGSLSGVDDMAGLLDKLDDALSNRRIIPMQLARLSTENARIQYQFEKARQYPELSLVAQAQKAGDDFHNCFNYYQMGVQIQYPLFDGFLIRSQISEKQSTFRNRQANERQTIKKIAGQIRSLRINYESILKRIDLQKQAVTLSKANYEDARGQYRAGAITMTQLGEFNLSYAESRFGLLGIYFLQRELYIEALSLLEYVTVQ
jgi:outer membrane protein TolC